MENNDEVSFTVEVNIRAHWKSRPKDKDQEIKRNIYEARWGTLADECSYRMEKFLNETYAEKSEKKELIV